MRDPHGEPSDLIRSVSRALRVLEAVGHSPRGLTVKQVARRCDLTVATTYHLIRTLAYEGYVTRREDGTYVMGLEITDRFRELVAAFRGPAAVSDVLRRAARDTGYSHFLGSFLGERVAVTAVAEGSRSPHVEDLMPGFDDGAHATALGKALLGTLGAEARQRFLKDWGMPAFTTRTLVTPESLDTDLTLSEQSGIYVDTAEFQQQVACFAVVIVNDQDPERRLALGCAVPVTDAVALTSTLRASLPKIGRLVAELIDAASEPGGP